MSSPRKPLRELTDADIDRLTVDQLIHRLMGLNPFGGYSRRDRPDILRRTLRNYRDRSR